MKNNNKSEMELIENSSSEKVTLDYSFGDHPTEPDTIVITIKKTGINLLDEKHKHFMDILLKVMSSQMYAHVQGVSIDDVKY